MTQIDLNYGHDWATVEACESDEASDHCITLTFDGRDGITVTKSLRKVDALALANLLKTIADTIKD